MRPTLRPSRRLILMGAAASLAACGRKAATDATAPAGTEAATLDGAVAGAWRSPADRARDAALHPKATLEFLGLLPGMKVLEMWPGAGWWTQILAPFLAATKGKLYAATFEPGTDPAAAAVVAEYRKVLAARPDLYGEVAITTFGPHSAALAPPGAVDLVLAVDRLDRWMAAGLAEKAFHDTFAALKPGGVLGVVQARAPVGGGQDPLAADGLVQEAYVRQLAGEAGFRFDKAGEINAAPDDPKGSASHARRLSIGPAPEPDRMTLRFTRPQ